MTRTQLPAGTDQVVLRRLWPEPSKYLHDPAGWIDARLHEHLWSKQREIAQSIVDHRYTAVQSCHSAGKSYMGSRIACWWLAEHKQGEAFAVTTAPSQTQVDAILWREIRRAHRKGDLAGRITLDAHWYMGDNELVAYGRKPADYIDAEKAATAFQGIHDPFVLVILDEACGIPEWLWTAVDSLATNEDARVLAIGNPDDPASHFAKVCAPGSGWHNIQISAFDTPNFTGEQVPDELRRDLVGKVWVEERRKRWGETSPLFVSKVLGEFPDVASDTLISPALIRAAQERELPGLGHGRFGVDVARLGSDETAIYRNRDGVIRLEHIAHKQDTMRTAGEVAKRIDEYKDEVPAVIDVIGIGAGVFDRLREQGYPVHAFDAAGKAHNPQRFKNRRAEAWWAMRILFEDELIDLDPEDDELAAQLGSIKGWVDSTGRMVIETKDQMRKRGLPSPDRADAVVMSTVAPPVIDSFDDQARPTLTGDLLERAM